MYYFQKKYISLSDLRWARNHTKYENLFLSLRFGRVRMLKTLWKAHKSKDWMFLLRNYIQFFFSTPKKNIFFAVRKNMFSIFFVLKMLRFRKDSLIRTVIIGKSLLKSTIFIKIWEHIFLDCEKKYFFRSWEKNVDIISK